MITVNAYLAFEGTCKAAFNFYKSVFGGEFMYVGRYKDMPSPHQSTPDSERNKIMHVSLPISKETMLFGADMSSVFGQKLKVGDNISLSVAVDRETNAQQIFKALSAGGKVTMPMEKTFYGSFSGMLNDKFSINWVVSYEYPKDEE